MTLPLVRRKQLATTALALTAVILWSDPSGRWRAQRTIDAVRKDPFAGAGIADPTATGTLMARTVDPGAMATALTKVRAAVPAVHGTASFAVLVQSDGKVSDVRFTGGTLMGAGPADIAAVLEGARVYRSAPGAATVRTLLGPIDLTSGHPA